jgi:hypothetical protein
MLQLSLLVTNYFVGYKLAYLKIKADNLKRYQFSQAVANKSLKHRTLRVLDSF